MSDWTNHLTKLNACNTATAWARTQPDLATAWAKCPRGDWMLWLAGRVAGPPGDPRRLPLVGAAAECARLALPIHEAQHQIGCHVRVCLDLCDRYAMGDVAVTIAELHDVIYDFCDVCHADYVVYTTYAAGGAKAAEAATYAAEAATYAAEVVGYAAYDAAVTAAAGHEAAANARIRVIAECADIVRRWYPIAPRISA